MNEPEVPRLPPEVPWRQRMLRGGVALFSLALVTFVGWGLWKAAQPVPEQLQGMVDAEQINVATKVPMARVAELLVHEGQAVRAGEKLAVLESPELDNRRDQADAVLAGAQAAKARADTGALPENLESMKAMASSADAALELAEKTLVRTRNLYKEGVVAAQRMDEAQAARDAARGQAGAAHQQVQRASRGLPQADRDVVGAQVLVAQAGVRELQSLQRETHLLAPVDGEVGRSLVRVGELVPLGFPVFTLVVVSEPWVSLNVREDHLAGLAPGREIEGTLPALGGQRVRFRVRSVAAQGEFATWRATRQSSGFDVRSFEVRLVPVQHGLPLRPGMSVLFDWPPA
jgi:HlyD family secretion protein